MGIILPETKIKGRTGWTESVAQNSETERLGTCRLEELLGSGPEEGEVKEEGTLNWGRAQIKIPLDCLREILSCDPSWILLSATHSPVGRGRSSRVVIPQCGFDV